MQVLRDGLTQRSCGCVLLRQTLQTCCFDEPGGEETAKNFTLKLRTLTGIDESSPGHVSLCPVIRVPDLYVSVTQSLAYDKMMFRTFRDNVQRGDGTHGVEQETGVALSQLHHSMNVHHGLLVPPAQVGTHLCVQVLQLTCTEM